MQNDTDERTKSRRTRGWVLLTASAVALAVISTTVYAQAQPDGDDDKAAVSGQAAADKLPRPEQNGKSGKNDQQSGKRDEKSGKRDGKSGKQDKGKDKRNSYANAAIVEWDLGNRDDTHSAARAARSYDNMINRVRAEAGPILRSDMRVTTQDRTRYIIVRVRDGGEEPVDLYFQAHNMYLIGWATHNDNENVAAFALRGAENDRALLQNVPDSVVLTDIPQDYRDLADVAQRPRDTLSYGRVALVDAVQTLRDERTAYYHPTANRNHAQAAGALMTMIVAVAEAARFSPLSHQVHHNIMTRESSVLSNRNLELINDWTAASRYAFHFTRTHEPPRQPLHFGNYQRDVHSWVELAAVLALAHYITPKGSGSR